MAKQSVTSDRLTATAIAEAAIRLPDHGGPDALSFRAVGDALGVSQTTIHRRCGESTAGLLDLCMDHLATQLPTADPGTPWPEGARRAFTALYEVLIAHPSLVALRGNRPWMGEVLLERLTEPLLQSAVTAGMTPTAAVEAYRRLYLFTLGCAAFVDHSDHAQTQQRTRVGIAVLPPARFPFLTGNTEDVLRAVVDHNVFHAGLQQMIDIAAIDLYPLR
ncbi:AcrR family transcriptional regulator [Kitasatospora sp. MAP12-15]|uniref:TetR/AcrR family transcriptional regulator C-terminal domain-containing protein n=1 Tax=Kitasatospora sp. MAP12-15 TaxID=3035097 RepID=UPI003D1F2E9D